jgi:hypothetical protein
LVDRLGEIASNQTMIDTLLGNAAYAMDVLKGHARHMRHEDFKKVTVIVPPLEEFNSRELEIIKSIKFTKQEKDTGDNYRPRILPVADIAKKQLATLKAARSTVNSK